MKERKEEWMGVDGNVWELFLLDRLFFFIRLLNITSDAAKLIVNNSSVHLLFWIFFG